MARPRGKAAARKHQRLLAVITGMVLLGVSATLVLFAFEDSITLFYGPSDIIEKGVEPGQRIRLGGLVAEGSVAKGDSGEVTVFVVTDTKNSVQVSYRGILPDLFREGQGVVMQGSLKAGGTFVADEVLAKHDETYMPPEVADALKRAGTWRHAEDAAQ